ncbi:methyl-accepting chemotaxis protein [Saccharospirillum mangrovi]|uniref:methyl-accepting chemotaxis protein n=1 Tax=Saccharospirillum mangrovi TaxID=2161747 RepID=UPI000D3AE222|nr:methyl-accepting chemotaxis protein [Saccharospirillum mangrovi]
MFENLKTRTRLNLGFGTVTAGLVLVALISLLIIWRFNLQVRLITNEYAPAQGFLLNADRDLQQALVAERSLLVTEPGSAIFEEQKVAHAENIQQAHDRVLLYAGLVDSERSNGLVAQYLMLEKAWQDSTMALINRIENSASDLERNRLADMSLSEIDAEFNTMRGVIDEIGNELTALLQQESVDAESIYRISLAILAVISLLMVAIALIFSITISRSIFSELGGEPKTAAEISRHIAEGHLDVPINLKDGDDSSILAALQIVRSRINDLIKDMNRMSHAHAQGQIDVVIDANKFGGAYRTMAEGLNQMVQGHIVDQRTALDCIEAFGAGKMDAPLAPFPGKKVFINTTIEKVRSNFQALIDDTNKLVDAAVDGELNVRADESVHQGDFRKIVAGLNSVMNAFAEPIDEITTIMQALEKGDLTQSLQNGHYRGRIKDLQTSINATLAQLNKTIQEVLQSAGTLGSAASGLNSTSRRLNQATLDQAANVEETSASIEEMSASIDRNAKNAKSTESIAQQLTVDAEKGSEAVERTITAMKKIAEKIGIIDNIAYQTNLLALNATVEATKAGNHGRGFAVVAAEVRRLAEQSQGASQEIGQAAKHSVELSESAGKLFADIVPTIQKTFELVREVSVASAEQTSATSQINAAMEQLNTITQSNADSAENLTASADELSDQANHLRTLMAFFRTQSALPGR